MTTYQLDFIGGDSASQLEIDERRSKYTELAAFMNAGPDEIGQSWLAQTVLQCMLSTSSDTGKQLLDPRLAVSFVT